MTTLHLDPDPRCDARGLETLAQEAWTECGRAGRAPAGWRPFDYERCEGIALREGGALAGYAAVRALEGMDGLEFLYVRRAARRLGTVRALIGRAHERLKTIGITRTIYAGFGWWRAPFPAVVTKAFLGLGWRTFQGVFLARPLEPGGPEETALPPGYEARAFRDDDFRETCDVMLVSPEPEAIYWDVGLCRRSILNAGNPLPPLFPDGRGQLAVHEGRIVAFALSTSLGYVNHVYVHPDHRGRGLGAAVLTRLLAALARREVPRATILTHETNPGAIALYERLGFQVDVRFPQFYIKW
jgi:ribosomal protein S18 acetylase RimI-like enzyme